MTPAPAANVKLPHHLRLGLLLPWLLSGLATFGCAYCPQTRYRETLHNPFPQLKRVAILPFFNQSSEPTVDGDQVAEAYYAALQAIPGFEVLPVGVAKAEWLRYAVAHGEPTRGQDFQRLAQAMGVEALVVGSVTDFDPYYPPRLAMTVHWYAANEGFHSIPAGYGLPWGTAAEKQIPRRITREAEFELARSQLATQTPPLLAAGTPLAESVPRPQLDPAPSRPQFNRSNPNSTLPPPQDTLSESGSELSAESHATQQYVEYDSQGGLVWDPPHSTLAIPAEDALLGEVVAPLPADWPDATDLIPDPPSPLPPPAIANHEPILSHTRLYRGDDLYFTNRLADYVETGDDARPGGWQDYLKRSDDFIRFCCHLHVTEMLESRGGSEQSDLILRWPLSRY